MNVTIIRVFSFNWTWSLNLGTQHVALRQSWTHKRRRQRMISKIPPTIILQKIESFLRCKDWYLVFGSHIFISQNCRNAKEDNFEFWMPLGAHLRNFLFWNFFGRFSIEQRNFTSNQSFIAKCFERHEIRICS